MPARNRIDLPELPELAVIGAAAEQSAESNESGFLFPEPDGPDGDAPIEPWGSIDPTAPSQAGPDSSRPAKRSARERLTSRQRQAKPRKRRVGLVIGIVLLVLLLAAAGFVVGGFAWLRWYAHDDAADFQGTWYVSGSETPIEISADAIRLTDTVSYRYRLDTHDKTIEFSIGNMTGYGSYRFSLDRTQLVIFDGRMEADAVMSADIRWLVQALIDEMNEEPNDVRAGLRKNLTFLTREPLGASSSASTADGAASADGKPGEAASPESDPSQPVWSADSWLNQDGADSTSSADDVSSLLDSINDLPLDDSPAE